MIGEEYLEDIPPLQDCDIVVLHYNDITPGAHPVQIMLGHAARFGDDDPVDHRLLIFLQVRPPNLLIDIGEEVEAIRIDGYASHMKSHL